MLLASLKHIDSAGVNKREVLIVTPAACPAACPSPLEGTTQQPTVPLGPSSPHFFSFSDVQNPWSSLCYSTRHRVITRFFITQGWHLLSKKRNKMKQEPRPKIFLKEISFD